MHESNKSCPNKNNSFRCINCQGNHLATSYEYPIVVKHKLMLSLAVTKNIPLVDARRKIMQDLLLSWMVLNTTSGISHYWVLENHALSLMRPT